jgi:hypothetical protein
MGITFQAEILNCSVKRNCTAIFKRELLLALFAFLNSIFET